MKEQIKHLAKKVLSSVGIHLTKNQKYDALSSRIMRKTISSKSICVDVGCHKGEVLDEMIKYAPEGIFYAFEPIPAMFDVLQNKYGVNVNLFPFALSDQNGETKFQHVVSNPAYSGIKRRTYQGEEEINVIQVLQKRLDDIIPAQSKVDFIKIDVEGAEMQVLKGAANTIKRSKPVIVFEHGLGASEHYGTTPEDLHLFLTNECGLRISTMDGFLKSESNLEIESFSKQFHKGENYYFVAHA
jgi:FkbM family methyltransferase